MEYLGVGVGLRRDHFDDVLNDHLDSDWFEIISENFMTFGGKPYEVLADLQRKKIPLIAHGLGLSLGSPYPIASDYKQRLKSLLETIDSEWFSDHLCFSSAKVHQFHDLLPALKTKESLNLITDKINQIQDCFGRPFAIENISYYGESEHNTVSEIDFINELLERTNCHLLLDINNIYVNANNFQFDPKAFLRDVKHEKVIQIHLAGHDDSGDIIIDSHGADVCDDVWGLYRWYLNEIGRPVSTLIERDNDLPSYFELNKEVVKAKGIIEELFGDNKCC